MLRNRRSTTQTRFPSAAVALHAVELPFFGVVPNHAQYIPHVKVLFSIQLVIAAVFLALVMTGNVKRSLEETVEHVAAVQDGHTALLNRHTVVLNAIAKHLGISVDAE